MYTLNFLNNYFIAILTTAAVSFTLVSTVAPSTAGSAAAV
jgi:membrane-bound acyltransferase YfiQ involved in biofilm formation